MHLPRCPLHFQSPVLRVWVSSCLFILILIIVVVNSFLFHYFCILQTIYINKKKTDNPTDKREQLNAKENQYSYYSYTPKSTPTRQSSSSPSPAGSGAS